MPALKLLKTVLTAATCYLMLAHCDEMCIRNISSLKLRRIIKTLEAEGFPRLFWDFVHSASVNAENISESWSSLKKVPNYPPVWDYCK